MAFREFEIHDGAVSARIAPERGGLVTSLTVAGRKVLFMDRDSFEDPAKNVRGGVPILFPFAGRLKSNRFEPAGTLIRQHGFARNKAWHIRSSAPDRLAMQLASDPETQAAFPYAFELEQSCSILPRGLSIALQVTNTGEVPMPVAPGWHPYFVCPASFKTHVKALNVSIDPQQFDAGLEFELGAEAPAGSRAEFEIPELGRLALGYSTELRHLHFWSLPGRDFICIEPFTGDLGAINRPAERVDILPGQSRSFRMTIELT